jgi:hypothetical protein
MQFVNVPAAPVARRRAVAPGRPRAPFLFAMLVLLALTVACKKPPVIETVMQTPYLGLPQQLDHVYYLDVARLRDRDFIDQLRNNVLLDADLPKQPDELRRRLGFDPLEDVDNLVIGARGNFDKPGNPFADCVFLARGRFANPGVRLEALRQMLATEFLIAPPPFKKTTHSSGGYDRYALEAAGQYDETVVFKLNFGFPNDRLMVFSFSPALLGETLDVIAGEAEGIRKDEFWLAMLQRPNVGAMIWGTGNASSRGDWPGAQVLAAPGAQQYFFDLDFGARFQFKSGLVCGSIDAADKLAGDLKVGIKNLEQTIALVGVFMPETAKLPGHTTVLPRSQTAEINLTLGEQDSNLLYLEWRRAAERRRTAPLAPAAGN